MFRLPHANLPIRSLTSRTALESRRAPKQHFVPLPSLRLRYSTAPPPPRRPWYQPVWNFPSFVAIILVSTITGLVVELTAKEQEREDALQRHRAQVSTLQDLLDAFKSGSMEPEEVERRLRAVDLSEKRDTVGGAMFKLGSADRPTSWWEALVGRSGIPVDKEEEELDEAEAVRRFTALLEEEEKR
ncbi:hypothetical protein BT69DRAFT_1354403 [Atractiella rhizophila]|nr:hypothetical protein BT69DRAFT_1354403 [Atractiella rhizophila]